MGCARILFGLLAIAAAAGPADVVRIDKGHAEGLEPNVTEALSSLMVSARGGKVAASVKD